MVNYAFNTITLLFKLIVAPYNTYEFMHAHMYAYTYTYTFM